MELTQAETNILKSFKGKRILFLENSSCFDEYGGQEEFVAILDKLNIEHTDMFSISEDYTIEQIKEAILEHDAICFMTQWVYEIAGTIRDYMFQLQSPKDVIEIYINEPSFYYAPETCHTVYIYTCDTYFGEAEKETEKFYKLSDKPYWDYKNKFDE